MPSFRHTIPWITIAIVAVVLWLRCGQAPSASRPSWEEASGLADAHATTTADVASTTATDRATATTNAVEVRVVDAAQVAVAGAAIHIAAWGARHLGADCLISAWTDTTGRASIESSSVRHVTLVATAEGFAAGAVDIDTPDETSTYTITLLPAGQADVEFVDLEGAPIPGLVVTLFRAALPTSWEPATSDHIAIGSNRRAVASRRTDEHGRARFERMAQGKYWVQWDPNHWAEIEGPDGNLQVDAGLHRDYRFRMGRLLAMVTPRDVLALEVDGPMPKGLSSQAPSSIQSSVHPAAAELASRHPGARVIVLAETEPNAQAELPKLPVRAWTAAGTTHALEVPLAAIPDVVAFDPGPATRNIGSCRVAIDVLSSDGVNLAGAMISLARKPDAWSLPSLAELEVCAGNDSMRQVPAGSYDVTLRGWGSLGDIQLEPDTHSSHVLSLKVPARLVDIRLLTPDGYPVAFAIEYHGRRMSTFRGGKRRVVLGVGDQSLRFQAPGFEAVDVRVNVPASAPRIVQVDHEFRW